MTARSFTLGLLLAAAYLSWEFGPSIVRYRAMQQALVELESCATDTECEQAWARVQAVKGTK